MKNRTLVYAAPILFLVLSAVEFQNFVHSGPRCVSISIDPNSNNDDINAITNDLGILFNDAGIPRCAATVSGKLTLKLNNILIQKQGTNLTNGWLAGVNTQLAITTALQLGANGVLTWDLVQKINRIAADYRFDIDESCGFQGVDSKGNPKWLAGNSCFDDYAIAASGYAWIAAWYAKTSLQNQAKDFANKARSMIILGLSSPESQCIHDPMQVANPDSNNSPCNGSVEGLLLEELKTRHRILSLNHGFENAAYGIGLMSSISSALTGLDVAGWPLDFSTSPQLVSAAQSILYEAQSLSDSTGAHFQDCYAISPMGEFSLYSNCGDIYNYSPNSFPVKNLYSRYFGGIPNTVMVCPFAPDGTIRESDCIQRAAYRFNLYSPGAFEGNVGKGVVYYVLGNIWAVNTPSLSATSQRNIIRYREIGDVAQGDICAPSTNPYNVNPVTLQPLTAGQFSCWKDTEHYCRLDSVFNYIRIRQCYNGIDYGCSDCP